MKEPLQQIIAHPGSLMAKVHASKPRCPQFSRNTESEKYLKVTPAQRHFVERCRPETCFQLLEPSQRFTTVKETMIM